MLVLRLQRTGRKNSPSYRLVVTEHTNPVRGKCLEIIGHYLPSRDPSVFECNTERVSYWIGNGARPSDTVARLLIKNGMKDLEHFTKRYTKKRPKKEPEVKPEAPAPAPAPAPVKDDKTPAPEAAQEEPKQEDKVPVEPVKEDIAPSEPTQTEPEVALEEKAEEAIEKESDKKEETA